MLLIRDPPGYDTNDRLRDIKVALFITTLTNKGDQQMGPVLTIPTG